MRMLDARIMGRSTQLSIILSCTVQPMPHGHVRDVPRVVMANAREGVTT
jgi:hypothetical protein